MHDPESGDTSDEIIELTEGWSVCNDDIYSIANQLLSLAFAVKYFGDDSSRSRLLGVCESFYSELGALGEQVEPRPAFNYDRVYEWLRRTLEDRSAAPESEDVLVDEDKSTLYAICPISRRGISQPVSQKFSDGDDSCDHVFDQTSIKELIRASKCTSVSCPVAACSKKVYESRLHRDWESVHWKRHQEYLKALDNAKGPRGGRALYL